MELAKFELKPEYYGKKVMSFMSILTALLIIIYAFMESNYYILVLSFFFIPIPFIFSFTYLKVYANSLVVETKNLFLTKAALKTILFKEVDKVKFEEGESRIAKSFFASAQYVDPEYLDPIGSDRFIFTLKDGKRMFVTKVGTKRQFQEAFEYIKKQIES